MSTRESLRHDVLLINQFNWPQSGFFRRNRSRDICMRQCAMSDATAWFSATRLVAFAENDAVHLRAAVCEVGCNRVVRRRGLMRPLHAPLQGRKRAGATTPEVWQPIFPPALLRPLQADR